MILYEEKHELYILSSTFKKIFCFQKLLKFSKSLLFESCLFISMIKYLLCKEQHHWFDIWIIEKRARNFILYTILIFSLYNHSIIIMCKQSFVTVCIRSKKHKLHIDDMLTVHTAIRKKRPVLPFFEELTEAE